MIGHGFRGMLSGFGAIVAPSVTTTGAVTAGTQFLAPDGSASAPSYAYLNSTNLGSYRSGSGVETHVAAGIAQLAVSNGDITFATADLRLRGAFITGGEVTPSQITADQNDYAGMTGGKTIARLSSDASRTITGLSGGFQNRVNVFWNVGAQDIVFAHQNVGSSEANRIITSTAASVTLTPGQGAYAFYDDTADRWRLFKLT